MEIYKVELKATNSIKNIAYSEKTKDTCGRLDVVVIQDLTKKMYAT